VLVLLVLLALRWNRKRKRINYEQHNESVANLAPRDQPSAMSYTKGYGGGNFGHHGEFEKRRTFIPSTAIFGNPIPPRDRNSTSPNRSSSPTLGSGGARMQKQNSRRCLELTQNNFLTTTGQNLPPHRESTLSASSDYNDSWPTPSGAAAFHARGAPPPLYQARGGRPPSPGEEILPVPRSPSPIDIWPGPNAPRAAQLQNARAEMQTLKPSPGRTPNVQYQDGNAYPFGGHVSPDEIRNASAASMRNASAASMRNASAASMRKPVAGGPGYNMPYSS